MLPASAILENCGHCVCSDMKSINHLRLLHLSNAKSLKIVVSGTKPSTASKNKKTKNSEENTPLSQKSYEYFLISPKIFGYLWKAKQGVTLKLSSCKPFRSCNGIHSRTEVSILEFVSVSTRESTLKFLLKHLLILFLYNPFGAIRSLVLFRSVWT